MTAIPLRPETLKELNGKVVVITGSAKGIGAATVQLLHAHGAKVVHGDWDEAGGTALDASLSSSSVTFVRTDVTDYDSVLNLFEAAWKKYGCVDIAISNAGVPELDNWFDPRVGIEDVKTKPNTKVVEVNLFGTLYFARIASVFLKQNAKPEDDKSLVLVSSIAGFKESPGIPIYTATKHGVLGLTRSLRPYLPKTHNIRVNAICPWMTDTQMVTGIRDAWIAEKLPVNQPEGVARVMLEVALGTVPGTRMVGEGERYNGRAVLVEGGRGWDIEEGINATQEVWLGREMSRVLAKGQEVLGDGTGWVQDDTASKGKL